jgi:hypothetical protein
MNKLLKKNTPFEWTDKQQAAFDYLKERLTKAPILQYPDFDKEFLYIQTLPDMASELLSLKRIKKEESVQSLMPAEVSVQPKNDMELRTRNAWPLYGLSDISHTIYALNTSQYSPIILPSNDSKLVKYR